MQAVEKSNWKCHWPHVAVPEQHADGVDDGRLTEAYNDAVDVAVVDGMSCETAVQVVRRCVAVQQRRFHLTTDHLSTVPQRGHILIQICTI